MSLQRIAELAGVSIATVSNALNGTGRVSAKTEKQIKEIVAQGDFVIRPQKRHQQRERKHIIFTIADRMSSLRHSNYNMRIFEGVQARLESQGYSVSLFSKVNAKDIGKYTKHSAGIILIGHDPDPQSFVEAAKKPLVWVSRYETGTADAVLENNREIARLAADHFMAKGHKTIGYINDKHIRTVSDRGAYFAKYVREAGGKLVVLGELGIFDLMKNNSVINTDKLDRLLSKMFSGKEQPTAFFSPGDLMSLSVYSFFRRNGIRPVKDVDFVSCNNELPFIRELSPQPPTIDFNLLFMGERAADLLLWRIRNLDAPPQKILISPVLVMPEK